MVELLDWAPSQLGRVVTAPQGEGGQCVDLAVLWTLVIGKRRVWADAASWLYQAEPADWQRVWNWPTNSPPQGALVVWGQDSHAGTGPAGHIAIAFAANPRRMLTLDQNWGTSQAVRFVIHNYDGVRGWLVPR